MALIIIHSKCPEIDEYSKYLIIEYKLSKVLKESFGVEEPQLLSEAQDLSWCAYVHNTCLCNVEEQRYDISCAFIKMEKLLKDEKALILRIIEKIKDLEALIITPIPTLLPFHGPIDVTFVPPYAIVFKYNARFVVKYLISKFLAWYNPIALFELPSISFREFSLISQVVGTSRHDLIQSGDYIIIRFKDLETYRESIPELLRELIFKQKERCETYSP